MRSYNYSYQTIVRYSHAVTCHHFLLRCAPRHEGHQRIVESSVNLLSATYLNESVDTFGNTIHYGSMMTRHDMFVVASCGVATCDDYRIEETLPSHVYLCETSMTRCSAEMSEFAQRNDTAEDARHRALTLADAIYRYMNYSTGATDIHTTGAESFSLGAGVCQDFAHILIAMCRKLSIMARYVAGFVVGTGETHAWVEVYSQGAWWGIDPTHNNLIVHDYIKLAHGRDASDCSVIRGVHMGSTVQTTEVRVVVEPVD